MAGGGRDDVQGMAANLLCPIFITLVPRLIMMLPTWCDDWQWSAHAHTAPAHGPFAVGELAQAAPTRLMQTPATHPAPITQLLLCLAVLGLRPDLYCAVV